MRAPNDETKKFFLVCRFPSFSLAGDKLLRVGANFSFLLLHRLFCLLSLHFTHAPKTKPLLEKISNYLCVDKKCLTLELLLEIVMRGWRSEEE